MDDLIQRSIQEIEAKKKMSLPWKADEPHPQAYYTFDTTKQDWVPQKASPDNASKLVGTPGVSRIALHSWNIDFMLPFAESRMEAGLAYLETLVSKIPTTTAAVIFLQECVASDIVAIGSKSWVRERFSVTDADTSNWTSGHYGTTTLIDRRLPITACFRVHYQKTRMERDAFFVDVRMGGGHDRTVRLCNTHLESLALEPPFRPPQMQLAASYMRGDGIDGAIAAGDFNAIQPFDRTLHSDNQLKDAYLELGGQEDDDAGYTWGQQAATVLRERFGCSRMDKVYFSGQLSLQGFERFGADIEVSAESEREEIMKLGFEKAWITDHLGIAAIFKVPENRL
ncbi:hypothetical protein GQ53DRAFT_745919 [Thozetella sp. PMI_491]|nr:hypothetical protein GQ53DRAFT_745919 [Thozetella sp. PMI_491]